MANKEEKKEGVQFEATKIYEFTANGKSKHLKSGVVKKVNGLQAEILVNKGYGKVK